MTDLRLRVNGTSFVVGVDPLSSLGDALVEHLALRSVAQPCSVGACGACTVLLDGRSVLACLFPVGLAVDREVVTVEGLPADDPVVAAFVSASAFQCAMCTPGFVLAVHAMYRTTGTTPDRGAVVDGLAGNLCRCGSYAAIIAAALDGASSGGIDA